jgi:hypothetical protein
MGVWGGLGGFAPMLGNYQQELNNQYNQQMDRWQTMTTGMAWFPSSGYMSFDTNTYTYSNGETITQEQAVERGTTLSKIVKEKRRALCSCLIWARKR